MFLSSHMQAARGTLPEDVQKLFGDVEDYLERLQTENLSARARVEKDEILSCIHELKERYHWEFLPAGVPANFSPAQNGSDDSQSRSFTPYITSEAENSENNSQKSAHDHIILKQGYLEKRSRDPKIFGSEWQKRWCVLDNMAFYYYANEKSKHPKGMFAIENCRAQLALHLRKDSRRNCCFELTCPGKRTYEFTAANPTEAMDWVDQILFLLKDMKSFVIPCEEEDGESHDKEEAYDDIDSFDSPNATLHKDTTLSLEEEEAKEESDEYIYEILPDEELDFPPPFDEEDAGNAEKTKGFTRSYANYYQSLWDCTGSHPDELSFQRGDLIYIISKVYNMYGWWVGLLNSTVGIVPKDYLMPAFDVEDR
ncbi:src kinase-associated phosphoprotein 1 isoform X2 [Anolis carolinensis]|uniref:Src kinase-associated phosphoprotein 1 n=1 Tax=Anolis carolinensis TaxID=28377 RepID=A0A803TUC9_ANOCA|nr:PREDICTED: src kinase-associated phosphoprotein 1 isoform X2 [Anolis carolinensis]|eukprot:XP_003222663.1 PREDICTED: src kinase-associated phosphoprotein 1 isoform X2 [Anolis carolinensis]